jgi:hypothetical protein
MKGKKTISFEREYTMINNTGQGLRLNEVILEEQELLGNIRRSCSDGRDDYLGLAFSGGGIRSATFNLGVLQALAKLKLLREVDYLSTVSGGGYIGSWLSALILRKRQRIEELRFCGRERRILEQVESGAATEATSEEIQALTARAASIEQEALEAVERELAGEEEPPAIGFLRSYSNYLTPRAGLFSTDTLAAVANLLRNVYLNQAALIALLIALLLVPRLIVEGLDGLVGPTTDGAFSWLWKLLVVSLLGLFTAVGFIAAQFCGLRNGRAARRPSSGRCCCRA